MRNSLHQFVALVLQEASLLDQGEVKELTEPKVLFHRTSDPNIGIEDLDPLAVRMSRQSKRGSSYVGLYAYESGIEVPHYGERKIRIELPAGTRILDATGMARGSTSRISPEIARDIASKGIDAIVGYDLIGPPEWVVLRIPK